VNQTIDAVVMDEKKIDCVSTAHMHRQGHTIWIGRIFAWCEVNYLEASTISVKRVMLVLKHLCHLGAPGTHVLAFRRALSHEKRRSRVFDPFDSRHLMVLVQDGARRVELMLSCHAQARTWLEVVNIRAQSFIWFMLWWCAQMRRSHRLDDAFDGVIMAMVSRNLLDDSVSCTIVHKRRHRRIASN